MFSKTITSSSSFLMMPPTSRLLYYDFGMSADDDGFVEHFTIMRMTEAKPDDLRVLEARGFVKVFDDKVLLISDWKENNYIQKDRYTPSKYLEMYGSGTPDVYRMDTQVRLGKDRLLTSELVNSQDLKITTEVEERPRMKTDTTYRGVFELWGPGYPLNWKNNRTQIQAAKNLLAENGLDGIKKALAFAAKFKDDPFCPSVTSPYDLDSKWGKLLAYKQKHS